MAWIKDGFVILFSPLVQAVATGFAVAHLEPDQNENSSAGNYSLFQSSPAKSQLCCSYWKKYCVKLLSERQMLPLQL